MKYCLFLLLLETPSDELILARNGVACMPILLGSVEAPAIELRDYLGRITGADFALTRAREGTNGIHVGLASDFPWLAMGTLDRLGPEGFLLKSDKNNLYLVAAAPAGVGHAVTTFLQQQGCRWFFPGKTWEVVPKKDLIKGKWNEEQAPTFKDQRRIWYGFSSYAECLREYEEWNRHNRMADAMSISIGHSWYGFNPDADFKAHPEWFALVAGQRKNSKPCFSNPEVLQRAIKHAVDHPGDGMISLSPADGLGYCECEKCVAVFQGAKPYQAHGTTFAKRPDGVVVNVTSETLFKFVNDVAAAVAEKKPNRLVGCYAYSAYSHPPSFKLHPNVYLQTTTAFRRTDMTLEEQLQAFGKIVSHLGIREYYSAYQWDWDYPQNPAKVKPDRLQKDLRLFSKNGVTAVNAEASNNWAPRGLGYYVAARLMWDVNADVKALVQDFYENAFGPAAPPMQRYYERWYGAPQGPDAPAGELDQGAKIKFDAGLLKAAYQDLDEAAKLAKDQPDILARVNHLRMYAHYLFLRHKLDEAAKKKDNKAIVEAIKEETVFGGRLTTTNMIHTRPLLGKAFERRFKEHLGALGKEPTDGWRKVAPPPAAEDVEKFWEDDKKSLGIN